MKINTTYHGEIEYSKDDIITFKKGIPGFDSLKKFILFTVEENKMFSVLHSIEDKDIGFVVISPFYVANDYEFELNDSTADKLEIKDMADIKVLNTVTLNSDIKKITVNMKAPLVINIKSRLGEQIILSDDRYKIKYPLFAKER